jgi:hypothetical protein
MSWSLNVVLAIYPNHTKDSTKDLARYMDLIMSGIRTVTYKNVDSPTIQELTSVASEPQ